MGEKNRSTDAWMASSEMLFEHAILCWAVVTDKLCSKGIIHPVNFVPNGAFDVFSGAPHTHLEAITHFMKALGMLEKVSDSEFRPTSTQMKVRPSRLFLF